MRKLILLAVILPLFLFSQGGIQGPTVFLIGSPPGGIGAPCTTPALFYANLITGVGASCQGGVWTAFGSGGGGGSPAGNIGDIQLNAGAGAFGASIANQSGSTITVQHITVGSESLANNVTLSSGWSVDGDFTYVTGASAHATYAYSSGVIGDFAQFAADQAIPTTGNAIYQMQYNVTNVANPGGGMACTAYQTSNPANFPLPISLGFHTVYMVANSTPAFTDFQCSGTAPGQTVTIAGTAPGQPVLSWKLATFGGDLNVSGNTNTLGNLNTIKSVSECGVVGNGHTDDTAALQSCITNAPNYSTLLIPQTFNILVTDTINWHGKTGINLIGVGTPYNGPSFSQVTGSIIWGGPHNGTVIDIEDTNGGLFENFAIMSDTAYHGTGEDTGAAVLINVDQTATPSNIMTNFTFRNLALQGVSENPLFQGIQFAATSQANVEHMLVENSIIACSNQEAHGIGIHIGPSFNALGHLYQWNTVTNCRIAIDEENGGGNIVANQFNQNTIHVSANVINPIRVTGNDSEHCAFMQTAHEGAFLAGRGVITIADNRIAACEPGGGSGILKFTGGKFNILNNQFDQVSTETSVTGDGSGDAFSAGNLYTNNSLSIPNGAANIVGFKSMRSFTSWGDSFGNGFGQWAQFTQGTQSNFAAGGGGMYFDDGSQKFRIVETGPASNTLHQYVTPFLQDIAGRGFPSCNTTSPFTAGALPGSLLFDPAAANTPFYYCGNVGGSPGWTQVQTVTPSPVITLPANVNDTVDVGQWNWVSSQGVAFDVYILARDSAPTVYSHKTYRFSVTASENTGGWYKVAPLTDDTTVVSGTFGYDLEVSDQGSGHIVLRIRNTVGVGGFLYAYVVSQGASSYALSNTVHTGVAAPSGTKSDATLSQVGGGVNFYNPTALTSYMRLDTSAVSGTITAAAPTLSGTLCVTADCGVRNYGAAFGSPGGAALSTGLVGYTQPVAQACTITGYDIEVDTGTATLKFWMVTAGTALPTSGNSISTSGVAISTGTVLHSTTTSDFTTLTIPVNSVIAVTNTATSGAGWIQGTLRCKAQ